MKSGSSQKFRHFVVRLESGEELKDTLKNFLTREHARSCWFTGHGFLSECQFQSYNPDHKNFEDLAVCHEFSTVTTISGNMTTLGREVVINAFATIMTMHCGQQMTLSGMISHAKAFDLELHLVVFDDLSVNRAKDATTGLIQISRISTETEDDLKGNMSFNVNTGLVNNVDSEIPPISNLPLTNKADFAKVQKSSDIAQLETMDSVDNNPKIQGFRRRSNTFNELLVFEEDKTEPMNIHDWVIHPTLGQCTLVEKLKSNCIRLKNEKGALKDISLSYFNVVKIDNLQGKACFRLDSL